MLRKRDLLWLLAYPLYQIIGTIRHEASHALVAWLQGADIVKFTILPGIHENGRFYWGYVVWRGGQVNWLTTAAPYLCDLLTFALFFALCMTWVTSHRWLWLNAAILGMASPWLNSLYSYTSGLIWGRNDAEKLLKALPDGAVHAYFVLTLAGYLTGLWVVLTHSRMARPAPPPPPQSPPPDHSG